MPVVTFPTASTTGGGGNAPSTIGTGGTTFQQGFPAASQGTGISTRKGCTIINNGTHSMYVTEGLPLTSSTLTNSVIVTQSGGVYYCAVNGVVLTGQINITGTAGDAFYAAQY